MYVLTEYLIILVRAYTDFTYSLTAFGIACFLTHWIGTAVSQRMPVQHISIANINALKQRRKAKEAQESLLREKEAFKEREIATSQAAVQRYMEEMENWKKQAEINRAASDEYKRLLESV